MAGQRRFYVRRCGKLQGRIRTTPGVTADRSAQKRRTAQAARRRTGRSPRGKANAKCVNPRTNAAHSRAPSGETLREEVLRGYYKLNKIRVLCLFAGWGSHGRGGTCFFSVGRAARPPSRRCVGINLLRSPAPGGGGGREGEGGEAHGRKRQRKENRPGQRELRWNGRSPNPPAEPPARRSTAGIPPDPRGRRGEDPPWRQMPRGHSRQAGGQGGGSRPSGAGPEAAAPRHPRPLDGPTGPSGLPGDACIPAMDPRPAAASASTSCASPLRRGGDGRGGA